MEQWNNLSEEQRHEIIQDFVSKGMYDLSSIRSAYNSYARGGNLYSGTNKESQQMKIGKPYYSYDSNGNRVGDWVNYNVTLPEITIVPDSQLSPAERNYRERQRQRNLKDYTEQKSREYTDLQQIISQRNWENSMEKKALDYGQAAASGIGIGADIVSKVPLYSTLKGARTLSRAETPTDYAEGALWLSPVIGAAARPMYEITKKASGPLVDAINNNVGLGRTATGDWNGWIRIGNTEYRPPRTSLGVNNIMPETRPVSSAQLLYKIQNGKISEAELSKLVSKREAAWAIKNVNNRDQVNILNAILDKAANKMKGKRGANEAIIKAENAIKAETPEGRLQLIRDKYKSKIEEAKKATGINWSDQYSVMASMPDELKLSTVGFDENIPFLERYYNNVSKVIDKGGIQEKLLKSKELRRNAKGQWEGKFGKEYRLVEPTEYIKMRIANEKGYNFDLVGREPGYSYYPMHGTSTKDYKYLTRPSSSPGKNGYWTGIQDKEPGSSKALEYYQGKGASVPFFRMPDYELPIMTPNGMGSSNSYGGTGQSLLDMLRNNPGKIQRPTFVSDPQTGGIPFNEYNFGPNVPNPKSMWNTLDFEPNAGPLAYNSRDLENNLV